jgi:predicted extracellular nuclease
LIKDYIQNELPDDRVIVLGDLNDLIQEGPANNVFEPFLELPEDYLFADMPIAQGPSSSWSFPGWPSHLDHLLISDELFTDFNASSTEVACLDIAAHMEGGWSEYDYNVSDHRPVAMQLMVTPLTTSSAPNSSEIAELLQISDLMGRICKYTPNKVLLYHFSDGSVRKHISWSQNAPY